MDRNQATQFSSKDLPLREDVRILGALLGEILQEQGGQALFSLVESTRLTAIARREGDDGAEERLVESLSALPPADAIDLVRAFSAYFSLVNLAERVHRLRRRREYMSQNTPQPGSLSAVIGQLKKRGFTLPQVRGFVEKLQMIPVFTAHPTEAVRRSLLVKEQRIARALVDRLTPQNITPQEEKIALGQVRDEVTLAWQTEEHLSLSPTVADEVEHVLFYLSEVIYRVIPVFYEELNDAMREHYGAEAAEPLRATMIRFGSWVGGDMDGNPNVGPSTILATLQRHQSLFCKRYRAEVRALFDHLSQSESRVDITEALSERLRLYRSMLPAVFEKIPARYAEMPYRVFLWLVSERIEATETRAEHAYESAKELYQDLRLVEESLLSHKGSFAGRFRVSRAMRRVDTFGFYGAALDVRQDSLAHRKVVGELLQESDFLTQSAAQRAQRLTAAMQGREPVPETTSELTQKTLAVFSAIQTAKQRFGEEAIGLYIISMAQGVDDVLTVLFLARQVGLLKEGQVPLDIAPLFETVDDLERAPQVLQNLFSHPLYRAHLQSRKMTQHVMLGYSDSNKESGIVASRFALFQAQRLLAEVASAHQVSLVLFHGRGGTASRGGSKPREAILAEPKQAMRGILRVTEQGEIIHAKYGLRGIANRTLELMAGALVESLAAPLREPSIEWRSAMSLFAKESRSAYRTLVYDTPGFVEYFRRATPIDVIERLRIGSRPVARRSGQGLENLRAIPWVFAWTQSRHILPGWFGVGTGMEKAIEAHGIEALREMRRWPFFANLLSDVEMVLAKADLPIASRYASLAGDAAAKIFPKIQEEFERTVSCINEILEQDTLLSRDTTLQRSIRLRNPYVDPMSLLQVELLRRWREGNCEDAALEKALLTTVQGIARGLQNTG